MKVREFIAVLADIGAHEDIREWSIQAYDAEMKILADVTGVTVSPQRHIVLIHTDEL